MYFMYFFKINTFFGINRFTRHKKQVLKLLQSRLVGLGCIPFSCLLSCYATTFLQMAMQVMYFYNNFLFSFPWNSSDMGCDNTLRLKKINIEDFESTSTTSKPEQQTRLKSTQTQSGSTSFSIKTLESTRLRNTDNVLPKSPQRFHSDSRRDQSRTSSSIQTIEGIRAQDSHPPATIWHRHNSPLSSPTKSTVL